MQNWDRALELTTASQNSAGAATRMHNAAMEGLDATLNELTNSWQKLISSIANGDTFKGILKVATGLLKWLSNGNSLLKIFTIAIVAFNVKTLATNVALASQGKAVQNVNTALSNFKNVIVDTASKYGVLAQQSSMYQAVLKKEELQANATAGAYRNLNGAKSGSATAGGASTKRNISFNGSVGASAGVKFTSSKETANQMRAMGKIVNQSTVKTIAANISTALGAIQWGVMVASIVGSIIEGLEDALIFKGDEWYEKAQEQYEATQEEIDSYVSLRDSVEANIQTYDNLSKKMNKSAEEVDQLAEAAEALAEAVPESVIGYDQNGNPIVSTVQAEKAAIDAEEKLVEEAKTQIGNIGSIAKAEIRQEAEESMKNNTKWDEAQNVNAVLAAGGAGVSVAAASAIAAGLSMSWIPVVGQIGLAAAVIGAVGVTISSIGEEVAISSEELARAQQEATKIIDEKGSDLLLNLSYITSHRIGDGTVNGVSSEDRHELATRINNEWLNNRIAEIKADSIVNGKFDTKKFEEAFDKLGQEWDDLIQNSLDDNSLANAFTALEDVTEDLGDKTYASVEEGIDKVIQDQLNIQPSDPLYKSIKEAFFQAAYEGMSNSTYAIVKELEERREKVAGQTEKDKYTQAINAVKNGMTNTEAGLYGSLGITDNVDIFNTVITQYGELIRDGLSKSVEAATTNAIASLAKIRDAAQAEADAIKQDRDYNELTKKEQTQYDYWVAMAQDAANNIESAWNSLDISIDIPWEQLWSDLEETTERTRVMWETFHELSSGEGISIDKWKEFTALLDDIDMSALDAGQLTQYASALDGVENSLSVVNGQVLVNQAAVEKLAELERLVAEAQIEQTRQELTNKKYELEASKAIIDAQVATLEYQIAAAEGSADASDLKIKAEDAWVVASNQMNTYFVKNQGKVAEAMVKAYTQGFTQIAQKYNALQTAMADGSITTDEIAKLQEEIKSIQSTLTFDEYDKHLTTTYQNNIAALKEQLEAAKKASEEYGVSIENIELKLKTLELGLWVTKEGVGGEEAQKNADVYIGKLKEIYNILNRIQMLEHRLSTLETYGEYGAADMAGQYWQQQLDYTKELIDQYSFLTKEQKQFTNGYKDFILSTEGLEGVFSFDQYGQIIINWEKYIALQNVAIDGETTLREKADDLYETYTEMFEDLQGYQDSAIDYYTQMIDKQQEAIDAYVETEKKAAEIIEEIYQKILDTKLEAIDKEIEALEDLQEAREKAREDEANAREVSGLQTDLQRAMMDTSGASDSAQIQARQELNDKLDEIADDKYSEMLNNMTQQLEDQKEMLQEEFDEMFENLDWLYSLIETEFMNNEQALQDLWEQQETWGKQTKIEREEEKNDLATKISTYNQAIQGTEGKGGTIYDLYNEMINNKAAITTLDENLKTEISNASSQIATTIANWKSATSTNTGSTGAGSTTKYSSHTQNNSAGQEVKEADVGEGKDLSYHGSLAAGMEVELDREKGEYQYVLYDDLLGTGEQELRDASLYDRNVKIIAGPEWSEKLQKWMVKVSIPSVHYGKNYWMPASADEYAQGHDTYFHDRGWGKSGIKYAQGGFADFTGPAWLDGTPSRPEAVLNALQTQHFIKFTDTLDKMFTTPGQGSSMGSSIVIDSISFNVDSMSSTEDGEKAFNAFVEKFKEIGSQKGIQINSFKKTI